MDQTVLEVKDVIKRFGGVVAANRVNIYVKREEIVGLIGPNGSGKTTLFNCITKMLSPDHGHIILKGRDITGSEPFQIAHLGLVRTFQITRVFPELSVFDNLMAGQNHSGETLLSAFRRNAADVVQTALGLLDFVKISHLKDEPAGELSYGQQKLLELARCLMSNPEIVLLDEPTAGVNPTLIREIMGRIVEANEQRGQTFLIIEHNMDVIMNLAHRVYALNYGEVIAEGSPREVRQNKKVIESYFGV
jgi:branched-chain amino acid transport system ATP-binding protein